MAAQPGLDCHENGGDVAVCEPLNPANILPFQVLADWVMLCVPRTASTSLSVMLGLRSPPNGPPLEQEAPPGHYFGHVPASWLAEHFGLARWRRTFSFGFVRNPWDRMVSICARINPAMLACPDTFTRWLYSGCTNYAGLSHHVAGGTLIHQTCSEFVLPCSYIGRFETLDQDIERICRIIGRPVPPKRHHEQFSREPYQHYYTTAAKNWVVRHCWQDIQTFGYRFGE